MPAGVQIMNQQGVVQVDSSYRNYLLLKSGQFSLGTYPDPTAVTRWIAEQPPVQTAHSLLLVQAPGWGIRPTTGSYVGGRKLCNFGFLKNSPPSFQYYIFDLVPPNSADKFGLQVFDKSGQIIYNALDYPLKIVKVARTLRVFNVPQVVYTSPYVEVAYGSLSGGKFTSVDADGSEINLTFLSTDGNKVMSRWFDDNNGDTAGIGFDGNFGDDIMTVAVADVRGIPLNWSRG